MKSETKRIAVIEAGMSGLTAASNLSKFGFDVSIFEKSRGPDGRCATRRDRHGERACPFNSLYWNFFIKHRDLIEKNIRIRMVYNSRNKMELFEIKKVREQSEQYFEEMDNL